MPLLSAGSLKKQYGAAICFDSVTFDIEPGCRVGLIGANGCGKTTLLRIVAAQDRDYEGTLSLQKGLRVAFLEQNPVLPAGLTVREAVLSAHAGMAAMEQELERLHHAMAEKVTPEEMDRLVRELDRVQHEFEHAGGYDFESRVERIMEGVGIPPSMRDRSVDQLSGGERHRVALSQLLLSEPDLWLLDEPTNHLDVDGIFFLERFLSGSNAAAIIVSHDRRFLDTVTNETWEFEAERMTRYPAAYTASRTLREERRASQLNAFSKQQDFIKKQEEFIRRFGAGQRAREAMGRLKRLNRLERLDAPTDRARAAAFRFPMRHRLGQRVLRLTDIGKAFGDKTLFRHLDLEIEPGEVLAILGPNGAGKSTLFDICLETQAPDTGAVSWGESARPGILRQHDRFGDESLTALQCLQTDWAKLGEQDLRDLLGAMLFSGEDAMRPIRGFSGGERKRLLLTRMLLEGHNVLFFDEPTNHLDIQSREALETALSTFEGTIILISHDRHFIDAMADRSLWIEDGAAHLTAGGFTEAWAARSDRRTAEKEAAAAPKKQPAPQPRTPAKPAEKPAAKRTGPYAKLRIEDIEARIIDAETRIAALNDQFADPAIYQNPDKLKSVQTDIDAVRAELDALEEEYLARA